MTDSKSTKKKVDEKPKTPKKKTTGTTTKKKVEKTVEVTPVEATPEVVEEKVPTETVSTTDIPAPVKPKFTKIQMIIAGIVAVVVIAGIGMSVYYGNLNSKYDAAMDLYNEKKYSEAIVAFKDLKDYKESEKMIVDCNNAIAYDSALELFNSGNYVEAKSKFEAIRSFSDSAAKINECDLNIAYGEADALFADGQYFAAMNAFNNLGNFKDSAERAAACVRARPKNKKLYHNGSYKSSALQLKVKLHKSYTDDVFVKIYSSSGKLVTTMYIRPGGTVSVKLPAGKYQIKAGYGPKDKWFGTKDAFGDFGYYSVLQNGSSETFNLKRNYIYTLTLQSNSTKGTVGSRNENRTNF